MVIIVFSFNYLTINELTGERQWIAKAVKLSKNTYFKDILILKFVSKEFGRVLLLFPQKIRRCGLLLWFCQPRLPENSLMGRDDPISCRAMD